MVSIPADTCPMCGGQLASAAIECPHCGERRVGDASLPADAAQLQEELDTLNENRRRNNMLGFAFGVPGLAMQIIGGVLSAQDEQLLLVGFVLRLLGLAMLMVGIGFVAAYKGRNPAWALLGLIGCIGLLVILFLKDYHKVRIQKIEALLKTTGDGGADTV